MKKLLISAAAPATLLTPAAASAQAIPAAVVAVVDLSRVTTECNACRTAQAALRSQIAAEETREKSLGAPLQTEQKSIQTEVDALKGKAPDAALKSRYQALQTKAQQAQEEVDRGRAQLQANRDYISKQIQDKLDPIYQQVMQRRGANLLVEAGTTLAKSQAVDVTNDVIAALNAALPSVVTTAPATQAPQGR